MQFFNPGYPGYHLIHICRNYETAAAVSSFFKLDAGVSGFPRLDAAVSAFLNPVAGSARQDQVLNRVIFVKYSCNYRRGYD